MRSPAHRLFIRSLPCCMCGRCLNIQCAHIRIGTGGGMGLKPSDSYTVPLCFDCHARQHQKGERSFWGDRLDAARIMAQQLAEVTGDFEKAVRIISGFRCHLIGS